MDLEKSLRFFNQNCRAKNLSPKTIKFYSFVMRGFFKFTIERGKNRIECVKENDVVDYFAKINQQYASATVKGRYLGLHSFFSFLFKAKVIRENPMELMKMPKLQKKIIYSFSNTEIDEILSCYDKTEFVGLRNYTIMCILLSTGIRKTELLNLRLTDIDLDTNFLNVNGKGKKQRLVPIGIKLRTALVKYMKERYSHFKSKRTTLPYLLLTKDGNPLSSSGLTTVFKSLKNSKKRWSTRVSPHTFRHTFAKLFLLNGGDLYSLQKILGHEDISITRIYVEFNEMEIKAQAVKYNPLDNNGWKYM